MSTHELHTDILIVGGGVGGCAAALAASALGRRVIMTEPTAWIGGQLTSQAVPPDESQWIEQFGCTRRYRQYRNGVRQYFRDHYPITAQARAQAALNPGMGGVSRLCHEPKIGVAVFEQMLADAESRGLVRILHHTLPISADTDELDRVRSVTVRHAHTGNETTITAAFVLDASELGDLLPLAGAEYLTGAESQDQFGEPHAPTGPAQPDNVQAITWCFPLAFDPTPGANHVMDKPEQYERWRDYVPSVTPRWPGRLLSWIDSHPHACAPRQNCLFPGEQPGGAPPRPYWMYRKIIGREHFAAADQPHEVTLVNWPMNDYMEGNLIDKPADEVVRYLHEAKQLALSLAYWLQTDAPNHTTGGTGYPGLYLRPDITRTEDGLAMMPYIRESRRIAALFTVTEQHVGLDARKTMFDEDHAAPFADSVGIGHYRIDLHPSTGGDNYIDVPSLPFQIPLGSLIPVRVRNLLAACKNLGVTHIANGCYRLHPVEWNIGESAGLLAAFCMEHNLEPHAVHASTTHLVEFQRLLRAQGVELNWPQVP